MYNIIDDLPNRCSSGLAGSKEEKKRKLSQSATHGSPKLVKRPRCVKISPHLNER